MTTMVRIEDAVLRVSDISHLKWERGHSYTNLRITMRDGAVYIVREYAGSAYAAERTILEAIEANEAAAKVAA